MVTNRTSGASRPLIILGLIVLILMLVSAAFALGVYVGEHGWTRAGLRYQPGAVQLPGPNPGPGFGGAPAPGQVPPAAAPGAGSVPSSPRQGAGDLPGGLPPGRPQVTGRILNITPNALNLATPDGPRLVNLVAETRYLDQAGEAISFQDLQRGDVVAVFGRLIQGGNRQFQANLVVKLPAP
jgi:hypothetical protein